MESITKTKLGKETLDKLVSKGFGDKIGIQDYKELTDGFFNMTYKIVLTNGKIVVLKIAPKPDLPVLRYEYNIMETEVYVMNRLSNIDGLPVAKVYYYDHSKTLIECDYFFMSFLKGQAYNKIKDTLSEKELYNINQSVARTAKKIHQIKGDYFGFINIKNRRYTMWRQAMHAALSDLIEDACDMNQDIPVSQRDIDNYIDEYSVYLDDVKEATLIHKDLWEGNIFVDEDSHELSGVIDCERALYGDPLLDAVCGSLENEKGFMETFIGNDPLSNSQIKRINLYRFYLYLMIVAECPYRKYVDDSMEKWAREMLDKAMQDL